MTGIGRRAKYLLADLSSGDVLVMHLGMSGSFHVFAKERREHAGRLSSRALQARRPRPRGVSHVVRRHRHLQRSAPFRLDEARGARQSSTTSRCCAGSARSRSATRSTPRCWRSPARARKPASRRRCSTSASSPGWAISMSARRCIWRGCRRSAWRRPSPTRSGAPNERAERLVESIKARAQRRHQGRRLVAARSQADRRRPRHVPASISGSTTAKAKNAARPAAAAPSSASCRTAARRFIARAVRNRSLRPAAPRPATSRSPRRSPCCSSPAS